MYGGDTRHNNVWRDPPCAVCVSSVHWHNNTWPGHLCTPASSSRITPSEHLDTITITFHHISSSSHTLALTCLDDCYVMANNKYRITMALKQPLNSYNILLGQRKNFVLEKNQRVFFVFSTFQRFLLLIVMAGIYGLRRERLLAGHLISPVLSNSESPGGGNVCFNSDVGDTPGPELWGSRLDFPWLV